MKLVNYFILTILIIGFPVHLKASNSISIYVWDFIHRDGKKDDLTANLTEEFEEVLIKTGCFDVLQRRNYSRILSQRKNEEGIMNLESIPKSATDKLKALEANTVVFGEVYDDLQSGQTRVSVTLESFDGTILKKESILFPRFIRIDPTRRQENMMELAEKIPCTKQQTAAGVTEKPSSSRPASTLIPQTSSMDEEVGSTKIIEPNSKFRTNLGEVMFLTEDNKATFATRKSNHPRNYPVVGIVNGKTKAMALGIPWNITELGCSLSLHSADRENQNYDFYLKCENK